MTGREPTAVEELRSLRERYAQLEVAYHQCERERDEALGRLETLTGELTRLLDRWEDAARKAQA